MNTVSTNTIQHPRWFTSDIAFNRLYPESIQRLAPLHWTPLMTARKAAGFLNTGRNVRVLDIGSGVGKFCLCAGHYTPRAHFFGVEQRQHLIDCAENAKKKLALTNVTFLHKNITEIDFGEFEHFYFFNSFYENLSASTKIDYAVSHSEELFQYYSSFLLRALFKRKAGTRLVTYHCLEYQIPPNYHLYWSDPNTLLKFWIKE